MAILMELLMRLLSDESAAENFSGDIGGHQCLTSEA